MRHSPWQKAEFCALSFVRTLSKCPPDSLSIIWRQLYNPLYKGYVTKFHNTYTILSLYSIWISPCLTDEMLIWGSGTSCMLWWISTMQINMIYSINHCKFIGVKFTILEYRYKDPTEYLHNKASHDGDISDTYYWSPIYRSDKASQSTGMNATPACGNLKRIAVPITPAGWVPINQNRYDGAKPISNRCHLCHPRRANQCNKVSFFRHQQNKWCKLLLRILGILDTHNDPLICPFGSTREQLSACHWIWQPLHTRSLLAYCGPNTSGPSVFPDRKRVSWHLRWRDG